MLAEGRARKMVLSAISYTGRCSHVDDFGLMKLDKYVDALQNLSGDDAMGVLEIYPK